MARKKLVIFPFNGNGLEALDCIDPALFDVVGFIDDNRSKTSEMHCIYEREILSTYKELNVLAVPGSPDSYKKRVDIIQSLQLPENRFVSVIHPRATLGKSVTIGYNTLVMAGVVLTSNAVVGNHVCVLPNTVIHHDATVGDYTLIGSNVAIAGGCCLGTNCYVGSGSNIINGAHVGSYALIGLGSNIIGNVEAHARMVGNPARNLHAQLL